MRILGIIRSVLLTTGAVAGVLCVVLFVLAAVLGIRPSVVVSGSMEPTLPVGSLVLLRSVPAAEVGPGDIVTVPRPGGEGLLTHRVVAAEKGEDGIVALTLRGDANSSDDPSPYAVRQVGAHVLTLPFLGLAALVLRTPAGIACALALFAAAFLLLAPHRRSRSAPRR